MGLERSRLHSSAPPGQQRRTFHRDIAQSTRHTTAAFEVIFKPFARACCFKTLRGCSLSQHFGECEEASIRRVEKVDMPKGSDQ
eukprot:6086236-Amphidinium_carterae.1